MEIYVCEKYITQDDIDNAPDEGTKLVYQKMRDEIKDKPIVLETGKVSDQGEVLRHAEIKYGMVIPNKKNNEGREPLIFKKSHWAYIPMPGKKKVDDKGEMFYTGNPNIRFYFKYNYNTKVNGKTVLNKWLIMEEANTCWVIWG